MMSDTALLAAVRANPGEDTPRLALADYLDEHNDPARAEFIRLQVRLAAMPDFDPRKPTLEDREQELLAAHEAAWLGDWPAEVLSWTWERGFVSEAEVRGSELAAVGDRLFAHPVSRLRLRPDPYTGTTPKDWPSVHDRRWLSQLESLDTRGSQFDRVPGTFVGELLGARHLTRLKRLAVSQPDRLGLVRNSRDPDDPAGPDASGREVAAHLLASPCRETLESLDLEHHSPDLGEGTRLGRNWHRFPKLKEVGLRHGRFGNAVLRGLVGGPTRRQLARLDLGNTTAGRFTLNDVFSAGPLPALRGLDLTDARLTPRDLGRVVDGPLCPALRTLHMNGRWHPEFVEEREPTDFAGAVVGSDFWGRATGLSLRGNGLTDADLAPLSHSPRPAGVRELDLRHNRLTSAAVKDLCGAGWLGRLTQLDLSDNRLDGEGLAALGACKALGCLRRLKLGPQWLPPCDEDRDAGVALAGGGLKRLSSLDLTGIRVTPQGLDALLNSGALPHLRELLLDGCRLTADAVRVLVRSPRLKHLRRLALSGNDDVFAGGALKELGESPDLSPLLVIDFGRGPVNTPAFKALRKRLGPRLRDEWGLGEP